MSLRSGSTIVHVQLPNSAAPPQTCASLKARQCEHLAKLKEVLVAEGSDTVTKQALALGLSRSSAWKILRGDHKQSGLSAHTVNRMLASADLPCNVRAIIDDYVRQKLLGAYGHQASRLKNFRSKLRDFGALDEERDVQKGRSL
jgi:hypothetical protein